MGGSMALTLSTSRLALTVASGDNVDVRRFNVTEQMSQLFDVSLVLMSPNENIDFDSVVGQKATFSVREGGSERSWVGVVSELSMVAAEDTASGLSTYHLRIVPNLWFLTQRRNHRMFQQLSEIDIVKKLLDEWEIKHEWRLTGTYKKRKYRLQYGESDFAFASRMLEDAGVTFYFVDQGGESLLILSDAPQKNEPRKDPLPFRDSATDLLPGHATRVRMVQKVRPGKYTLRDHDYRLAASYPLAKSAEGKNVPAEEKLERFHYTPGAFLFGSDKGEDTPFADDKGKTRTDEKEAELVAKKRLDAKRSDAKVVQFDTSAHDVQPGSVIRFVDHPRQDLGSDKSWLVVANMWSGTHDSEWTHACEARSASADFRPPLITPKPKAVGVESATVVGPAGEEIHTDEFGRVRVHFHWDRESKMDDNSSIWIHVVQPWGGSAYGGVNLPRIGQEVIVDFLGGDPDRPVITGRVYTNLQKVPYKLPQHKTRSAWKSDSSPGSGGFNEIMFEDAAGHELVWEHAQKNRRRLVKNDEHITIGHDRQKLVKHDELERTLGHVKVYIGRDQDIVVKQDRRERVEGNSHITIWGKRNAKVHGNQSVTVEGNRHELVGQNHAFAAGEEIHISAGTKLVIEAARDLTIKGPGGFVRIDQSGVTIRGKQVKINSGGSAAEGKGASPEKPDEAIEAETDDVSVTLIGQ